MIKEQKLKIGIIGVGMVGGAVYRYFKSAGFKVSVFDKFKKLGSPEEVNEAEVVFICVPTPFKKNKGFKRAAVEESLKILKNNKIAVIKSTILPGSTEELQEKYPDLKLLFNPEFLSEKTADFDMKNPDVQIVGYTEKSKPLAKKILKILPRALFEKIVRAKEAEMVKYFHNVHGAIKVIFANQMYDLCQAMGIDYEVVKKCAAASKHILTDMYLNIWHHNYRGYGGSCFPKDIRALISLGNKKGVKLELLKTAEKINNRLMESQKIADPEKLNFKNSQFLRDIRHKR